MDDDEFTSFYFWRDGRVVREPRKPCAVERMLNCGVPCYDPDGGGDFSTWGRLQSLSGHFARDWQGLGKHRMPKEFLTSLLIMGVFDDH